MRLTAEEHGCKLYPAYKRVAKAKAECLPPASAFTVLPDQAHVDLQPLLDKTATRLLQLQKPVLGSLPGRLPIQLVLHCKWGIDGSTGHSQYKQAGVQQDDRMLATTLVPLQLETGVGEVIWRNPTPSSTRFCRPIRPAAGHRDQGGQPGGACSGSVGARSAPSNRSARRRQSSATSWR